MTADLKPHEQMALHFMTKKGLGHVRAFDVVQAWDTPSCWYFYYRLPQGVLELEVWFNTQKDDWEVGVTAFPAVL